MNSDEISRVHRNRSCYYTFCLLYRIVYYQFLYLTSMKKICLLIWILICSLVPVFGDAGNCDYDGNDPIASFKDCGPKGAIQ